ncbi:hypothetical protein [Dactylosporangium darangshiense]|uniref:Uncharacterized protein n=1 Tax=Dactylosporangium darangshiense TaxID=579108 RepID=A0ABP8D9E5_9ACTN
MGTAPVRSAQRVIDTLSAHGVHAQYAGAFGARGVRVDSMEQLETELRASLSHETLAEPGVTIIDARVDYSHNTDLFAHLHEGVLE